MFWLIVIDQFVYLREGVWLCLCHCLKPMATRSETESEMYLALWFMDCKWVGFLTPSQHALSLSVPDSVRACELTGSWDFT